MALPFHKLLQTLNSGSSIGSAAVAILASYGTDAHIYLPGIGALNGYTLGNWLDSGGTTPATVDNPVGLVQDASGTIHVSQGTTANKPILRKGAVNLLLNSVLAGATTGTPGTAPTGWSPGFTGGSQVASGASLRMSAVANRHINTYPIAVLANTSYSYSLSVNVYTSMALHQFIAPGSFPAGTSVAYYLDGAPALYDDVPATGLHRLHLLITVAGTAGSVQLRFGVGSSYAATGDVEYSNLQFEVGSTASTYAPTTSAVASNSVGNNYWEFDGVNDNLASTSVPFQQTDDQCVIAGASRPTTVGEKYIFSVRRQASATPIATVLTMNSGGVIRALWRNDAGTLISVYPGASFIENTPLVVSARKVGNNKVCRVNGVAGAVESTAIGATSTFDLVYVGDLSGTNYFDGHIYPIIAIKDTISDANLLILERWVGSLSGVTI